MNSTRTSRSPSQRHLEASRQVIAHVYKYLDSSAQLKHNLHPPQQRLLSSKVDSVISLCDSEVKHYVKPGSEKQSDESGTWSLTAFRTSPHSDPQRS